ncbi:hypothetical protein ACFC3O_31535 [Streptomyces sp. NPDC056007]|uniref:hypothetical protein n=1 Tax=Streptomyces sp. NPDC056007 TaxID=3345678 RepID=UPI0035DDB4D8
MPNNIPTVAVRGAYVGPDGRPLAGTVTFNAPSLLTFPDSDLFVAGPVVAVLDENGRFSVRLPATDAPNMIPSGWSYVVKENLSGVIGGRTFSVLLPKAAPDVDLADIAPTDPATPNYVAVAGSQIFTGSAAPTPELGRDGDFFTQYDTRTLLGVTSTTVTMWTRSAGAWAKVGDAIRGAAWYVSAGSTPSADTKVGDFLLRSDTGDVWQRSASGWGDPVMSLKGPKGESGAAGVAGSKVYAFANGSEASGVGAPGDFAIRTDTGALYQWVAPTGWVFKGSIRGPAGLAGDPGPKGEKGDPGTGSVNSVNGDLGPEVALDAADVGAIPVTDKGVAGGVATLDGTGKVPSGQLAIPPDVVTTVNGKSGPVVTLAADDVSALATAMRGAANGVAALDGSGKVPTSQVPAAVGGSRNEWSPEALGFAAWSVDPGTVANPSTKAAVVRRLYFAGINITEPTPVNAVAIFARGWAGSGIVPAARFYAGIYNDSGSRVATSGLVSTLTGGGQQAGTAAGAKNNHIGAVPIKLTATTTLQPGKYWAAFLLSAGSATDFYYMHTQNESPSAPANFFLGAAFQRAWCLDSQTSLPATVNQSAGEVGLDPAIMALALV